MVPSPAQACPLRGAGRAWLQGDARRGGWVREAAGAVLTPPLPAGSMYDGLADTYNSYGTSTKSSYYSKSQAGSGSWCYPVSSAST